MLAEAMVRLSRGMPTRKYAVDPQMRNYLALSSRGQGLRRLLTEAAPNLARLLGPLTPQFHGVTEELMGGDPVGFAGQDMLSDALDGTPPEDEGVGSLVEFLDRLRQNSQPNRAVALQPQHFAPGSLEKILGWRSGGLMSHDPPYRSSAPVQRLYDLLSGHTNKGLRQTAHRGLFMPQMEYRNAVSGPRTERSGNRAVDSLLQMHDTIRGLLTPTPEIEQADDTGAIRGAAEPANDASEHFMATILGDLAQHHRLW